MAVVTVEITRTTVLEPSPESARGGGEKVSLTVFNRASLDKYVTAVFAWNGPAAPSNDALKDGLIATVARFPHLAGRFAVDEQNRKKCFHLNDAGVRVVVATAAGNLADEDVSAHFNELYANANKERANEPLFQVQLTRYTCGGLVIGTACHHQVADGQSMSVFYTAWTAAVRTDSAVLPTPFVDRSTTAVPRSPPAPAFDHRNIEFKGPTSSHPSCPNPMDRTIKTLLVHYPDQFIADLKARVGARCSTFQCLMAHGWKKVMAARGLPPESLTRVRVAARELLSASYPAVVGAIRDAVARVDHEYIQSFIDFGDGDGNEEELDLEVDSWLGFRFHDLDFGFGPPCAFVPPDLPFEGLMIFVPPCRPAMPREESTCSWRSRDEHVEAFKHICYSLD
ncbi:hypothetical protein BRADI_4g24210v3 [Brachypodium distachyon]|uniref:Uncharacterized protein n=1 Tax=Brachypodium distachyon TaxID=15368 RepID=A0A0Q3HLX1_BRADI|nr:hypothetical protein BRADI_4g24210v3 [Brachypodium distachyon]